MRMIRTALLGLALFVGVSAQANAATLAIGDLNYMGYIEFGIPSGAADQIDYMNFFVDLAPGATVTSPATGDADVNAQDYFRSTRVLCSPTCPDVVATGASASGSNPPNTGIASGYTYLYAKYDGPNWGIAVWYIAGITGTIDIPATADGYGLSHYTLYNPTSNPPCTTQICEPPLVTPEPGTMLMLGTGLALLAARLRRRKA